jgi:FtsH-binding integral membrane protein
VLKTYPDNEHVAGAMTLYLDFINLFVHILRIILLIASGGRRD